MTTPLQQAAQAILNCWDSPRLFTNSELEELRKALDAELRHVPETSFGNIVEPVAWMLEEVDEWKTSDHSQGRACSLFTDLHALLSYKELPFVKVVSVTPLAQIPVAGRYRITEWGIWGEWHPTTLGFALQKMSLQKSRHVIQPHGGTYEVELLYPPRQGEKP